VAPELEPRTIVVNGMSKAFCMTGWRMGYTAAPKPLIAAMQMIQDQSTSNPSSISQKAALAGLRGNVAPEIQKMVTEFRGRRDLFVRELNAMPGIKCRLPEGAFYVFPSVQGLFGKKYKGLMLESSAQVAQILLDDFQVALVPGAPFGAEGYLRLSFVTSRAVIEKGLERIRRFTGAVS
jgi:aspartate aminotransferase